MLKLLTNLLTIFNFSLIAYSQQITPFILASGGGYSNLSSNNISFNIGESCIKTSSVSGYYITEGFEQGEIRITTTDTVEVKVYPNPIVNNKLFVFLPTRYKNYSFGVKIYTMAGQILYSRKYENTDVNILDTFDFSFYPRALYFVLVESLNNKYRRTFKIEKY